MYLGSPSFGPAYNCKKNCYYSYKIALRRRKADYAKNTNNDLYSNLIGKDGASFWKARNDLNKTGNMNFKINMSLWKFAHIMSAVGAFFMHLYLYTSSLNDNLKFSHKVLD